jgi:hypothetical protein
MPPTPVDEIKPRRIEPQDNTIKAPWWALCALGIPLLAMGMWCMWHASSRQTLVASAVALSLAVAFLTFVVAGASAVVKKRGIQLGGSAAMFVITFGLIVRYCPSAGVLNGYVYGNDQRDVVSNPMIYFRGLDGALHELHGLADGSFVVYVSPELPISKLVLWATADGWQPSAPVKVAGSPVAIQLMRVAPRVPVPTTDMSPAIVGAERSHQDHNVRVSVQPKWSAAADLAEVSKSSIWEKVLGPRLLSESHELAANEIPIGNHPLNSIAAPAAAAAK